MSSVLLIMRHGKSDWQAPYEGDHERPLSPRGRRQGARVQRVDSSRSHRYSDIERA